MGTLSGRVHFSLRISGETVSLRSALSAHESNARGMLHNEDAYPEPYAFKPERWEKVKREDSDKHPLNVAFGFGRRHVSLAYAHAIFLIMSFIEFVPDAAWQRSSYS